MKSLIFLFPLLLPGTWCFSQTFTLNQGTTSAQNYYEEIPYEIINGKMFVSVGLAGSMHRFVFDTGAPVTLSEDLVKQTGAPVIHKDTFIDAYGGQGTLSAVSVDDLRLGQLTFNGVAALQGLPGFYKCWQVEGVIGSNLLRTSIVKIIPERHLIILTDQETRLQLDRKKSIPLITNIGHQSDPKINIRFEGKTDLLLGFDTGEGNFLRISEDDMQRLRRSDACTILSRGYGAHNFGMAGAEKNAEKYLLKTSAVNVAEGQFRNVIFETNKNALSGIGVGLLKYGAVTLDFLHHRFYFEPGDASFDLDEKQWPFQPTLSGDKLVVGLVWQKEPSEVTPGQQIIAIDSVSCEHIDFCDIITRQSLLAGKQTAMITIKDLRGNLHQVQIRKE